MATRWNNNMRTSTPPRHGISSDKPPRPPRKARAPARKRPTSRSGAQRSLAPNLDAALRSGRKTPPVAHIDAAGDAVGMSVSDRLAAVEENTRVLGYVKTSLNALELSMAAMASAVETLGVRIKALENEAASLRHVDSMQTSTLEMARRGVRAEFRALYEKVQHNSIAIERIRANMNVKVTRSVSLVPVDPHEQLEKLKAKARAKYAAQR